MSPSFLSGMRPPGGASSMNLSSNDTLDFTHLPNTVLEALIPGYSLISRFLLEVLGFDISILVSVVAIGFGLATAWTYVYKELVYQFKKYFTSSIILENYDDIYDHALKFLADHAVSKSSRELRARSGTAYTWDEENEEIVANEGLLDEADDEVLFNFSNWEAKVPPRFEPHTGTNWFWHKGNFFQFTRSKQTVMGGGYFGNVLNEEEHLTISVVGRSTKPLKALILEARDSYLAKEKSKTTVRRPCSKEQRGRGRHAWMKVATRPSRPMETVVLDADQKTKILSDINEYLHPATPRWYANRGIPYRRGYLFHGPPGTGKTSLSFAIAGIFGLDIYCISLLEPTLTEEDLGLLFNNLPRRCVVLLEDIDSAGLSRKDTEESEKEEDKETKEKDTPKSTEEQVSTAIAKEVAKAIKSASESVASNAGGGRRGGGPGTKVPINNQGISLSGLLNAIDGVASHEGRVLFMTTNHIEKLDDALIRPGRVDMKIQFTLATKTQIRELFVRMYDIDIFRDDGSRLRRVEDVVKMRSIEIADPKLVTNGSVHKEKTSSSKLSSGAVSQTVRQRLFSEKSSRAGAPKSTTKKGPKKPDFDLTNLAHLASEFSARVPDDTFSPAEIQGFLLTRKTEPQRAVEEVEAWVVETLETKRRAKLSTKEREAEDAEKKAGTEAIAVNGTSTEAEKESVPLTNGDKASSTDSSGKISEKISEKIVSNGSSDTAGDVDANGVKE